MSAHTPDCYWHCTDWRGFRQIMATGEIRPNQGELLCRHGASSVSCCYRLGAVSLFDPSVRSSFLAVWSKAHKPLTIAFKLDATALAPNIVCRREAQAAAPGLMLRGEVCHRGAIPRSAFLGCLFVRVRSHQTVYLPSDELVPAKIRRVVEQLRPTRMEVAVRV